MSETTPMPHELRRSLSLPLMVLFGLGTTIGAGIYALTGKVAGQAGMNAPVSFLVASLLAAFTAFSFAELSARFPRSAGEALYVREGLRAPRLGVVVGWLVVTAGSVSAATICHGFVGYASELVDAPHWLLLLGIALGLGLLAAWGVRESVSAAAIITVLEIAGLAAVIWVGRAHLGGLPDRWDELVPQQPGVWQGIFAAAMLAFYAFLGFEDMVNVAEEVRDVRRILPLAIVTTLVLTALLYVLLATTAVLAVPPQELGASDAPLVLVYERSGAPGSSVLAVIGVLAMLNGALIQMIMASRVLYGLASQGVPPLVFGRVHPRTRTPVVATAAVAVVVAILALWFSLAPLARATSLVTLMVFSLVNLSLIPLKRRDPSPAGVWSVPIWVPYVGLAASAGFLVLDLWRLLGL